MNSRRHSSQESLRLLERAINHARQALPEELAKAEKISGSFPPFPKLPPKHFQRLWAWRVLGIDFTSLRRRIRQAKEFLKEESSERKRQATKR